MKTGSILQLVLPVMLLAGPSEEFFLEYPKKALKEFFQSLKEKKLPPKTSHMQHYHIHYYPIPFPLLAWKAPDKHYLDELYDDTRASFGWSDYRYNYAPEPSLILPSDLQQLWDDPLSEDGPGTDGAFDSIDRNSRGILVQVPVNRPVVFHLLRRSRQRRMDTAMT